MSRLRVALCQLNAVVGDLVGNLSRVNDALLSLEGQKVDLALFPELFLTGYPPEDLLLEPSFLDAQERALEQLWRSSGSVVSVVGMVEREGGRLYNAAAVCHRGQLVATARKELLPNYGVFDERRYFHPRHGPDRLFVIGGVKLGITICEDAWSTSGPIARLARAGAQLVVSLNASPYRRGVSDERKAILAARVKEAGVPILYVNLVGGQDELVFDGASMLARPSGEIDLVARQFEEQVVVLDVEVAESMLGEDDEELDEDEARTAGAPFFEVVEVTIAANEPADGPRRPLVERLPPLEEVYQALVLGTCDYVEKNGFRDVVIGISGGIDSALVATIATDALGAEHVHGVAMPSRFSSASSLEDAIELTKRLSIELNVIGIEPAHESLLSMLEPSFSGLEAGLAEENIQARIRGILLMALSNKLGWLVLTTGNKSEMAVGFSTLYGDMAGGFAVIRDVPKTLVYELAVMRNERGASETIPLSILLKAPSAELRVDQRDDQSLPAYAVLDPILEGYVEQAKSLEQLVAEGHEETTVRAVIDLVDHAEYKRRQAPPGVRVTSRGFGKDRRMPITNAFRASAIRVDTSR